MNLEELIFEMYKEKPLYNAKGFKREIQKKFKNVNVGDIYVKITNYQIAKYGEKLDPREIQITFEEKKRLNDRARYRKYLKINGRNN